MDEERLDDLEAWIDGIAGSVMQLEAQLEVLCDAFGLVLLDPEEIEEMADLGASRIRHL